MQNELFDNPLRHQVFLPGNGCDSWVSLYPTKVFKSTLGNLFTSSFLSESTFMLANVLLCFFVIWGGLEDRKKYLINLWQINEAHATFLLFYKCINIVFLHHNLEIKGCANFCPKKVEILENSFNLTILGLTGQLCNMRILQTSQHENSFFFLWKW